MKKLKVLGVPFLLIFSLLLLSACSGSGSQTSSAGTSNSQKKTATSVSQASSKRTNKDTLTIGLDADPPQLDPALSSSAVDRQVYQAIYNTLVGLDTNLKLVPELAKSWKISNGGKTYTFNLQHGVKFQDGTPFNAQAVKFNFERMLDPKTGSPRKSEINLINDIKVIDDYTVQVDLKDPYSPFLAVLTDRAGMMVSPTAVKKEGKDFSNHPVGTGPYQFVSKVNQQSITVKRFDGYWGPKAKIQTVVYRPFPDSTTRTTNLESGSVDIINKVAFKDISKLKSDPNIKLSEKGSLWFQGIMLNTKVKPFNNLKVRQAINIAIDRAAIAKVVYLNGVTPIVSPFPPTTWAYPSDLKVPQADPTKAKQLIKESGQTNISFTLKITNDPQQKQLGQMVQAMLNQVGIKVKLEMVEFGTLLSQEHAGQYQAMFLGWSGRPDPDGNSYAWFTTGGSFNGMGYSNAKVDKWLNQARTISDQSQRKALYDKVSKQLYQDAPYIFLFSPKDYKAMKSDVLGYQHIPDTMIRPATMYFK